MDFVTKLKLMIDDDAVLGEILEMFDDNYDEGYVDGYEQAKIDLGDEIGENEE